MLCIIYVTIHKQFIFILNFFIKSHKNISLCNSQFLRSSLLCEIFFIILYNTPMCNKKKLGGNIRTVLYTITRGNETPHLTKFLKWIAPYNTKTCVTILVRQIKMNDVSWIFCIILEPNVIASITVLLY